ncbi:bacitracin ABC transporter ATP-binding protein [Bacillus cereus]|uniref:Bacitracin ABC transporter ATP-binding protein n=1 Tax=Bacillus cereus TaxID=1396 RepID=A0A9X7GSM9_BACCE|nr:ABC transporter ATP-binding protein [Bacillus cereus]PGS62713.1 bacitracin ABC transporter ATP-binding protein [Bacillus cereus]
MKKPVVDVKNVQKVYGKKDENQSYALKDVSFSIQEGEFVGIMGPSGAGKSTLLNVLSTIDHPTSGEVLIAGKRLDRMDEKEMAKFRRESLGFIFQDYNLLHSLTIRENIALPLALANLNAEEIEKKTTEVAQTFGIYSILDKFPNEISGGQKQRAASSRAIVTKPNLIFADEPTGALDSRSAHDFLESLKHLNEIHTSTIMMVTHDAYAASFCERILFISDGVVSEELKRAQCTQKDFFQQILDILAKLGSDIHDII